VTGAVADALSPEVEGELQRLGARQIALVVLTFENASTVPAVLAAARAGLERRAGDGPAVLINVDAGSSDATRELVREGGLAAVSACHDAPARERATVPFHGVPGRAAALRRALGIARRVRARAVVLLEADVPSITEAWVGELLEPVLAGEADLVIPAHARRRYDGTMTNLLLAPLVRALFGRRLHHPLGGAAAYSARAVEGALGDAGWPASGGSIDLWLIGRSAAAGLAVQEAWLGPRRVESRTRTSDLPGMMAQALGGVFALMEGAPGLWLDVAGSEAVPAVGDVPAVLDDGPPVDVARLVEAFQRGVRDLMPIWEAVLAPETLGDVLSLEALDLRRFRFPDDLWARVVYDAALGYHYTVIHREHLLRALVPLYLGRTAAFILATRGRGPAGDPALLEGVAMAFEANKPYLRERWR
jgi:hypothetical protein